MIGFDDSSDYDSLSRTRSLANQMRQSFLQVRFLFLILVVLVGAVATAQPIRAQGSTTKIRWIHFARKKSSAVMSDKLYPDKGQMFRFRASKGQKLVVKLTSPANKGASDDVAVIFFIQSKEYLDYKRYTRILPGIDKFGETEWQGTLPATGVYEIFVSNPPHDPVKRRPTTYRLEVSIE